MTTGNYGWMRATDADRERVRTVLQDAHAEGRLTWDEFDSRTTALLQAKTYDQLAPLTADLPSGEVAQVQGYQYNGVPIRGRATNALAISSLACGVLQIPFWLLTGVPAIVLGHMARRQIRRTGEDGAGMALAGLILGYVGLALALLLVLLIVWIVALSTGHGGPTSHAG